MNAISATAIDRRTAARFFRVLGDPTRLEILDALSRGERTVGALVQEIGQAQPRISTHLACLRHCGVVSGERRGKEMVYRLVIPNLEKIVDRAAAVIEPIADRLATCTRIGPDWI